MNVVPRSFGGNDARNEVDIYERQVGVILTQGSRREQTAQHMPVH